MQGPSKTRWGADHSGRPTGCTDRRRRWGSRFVGWGTATTNCSCTYVKSSPWRGAAWVQDPNRGIAGSGRIEGERLLAPPKLPEPRSDHRSRHRGCAARTAAQLPGHGSGDNGRRARVGQPSRPLKVGVSVAPSQATRKVKASSRAARSASAPWGPRARISWTVRISGTRPRVPGDHRYARCGSGRSALRPR